MAWMWKEIPWIRAERMDNLRVLLGIRRIDRRSNARVKELCDVICGLNESVL